MGAPAKTHSDRASHSGSPLNLRQGFDSPHSRILPRAAPAYTTVQTIVYRMKKEWRSAPRREARECRYIGAARRPGRNPKLLARRDIELLWQEGRTFDGAAYRRRNTGPRTTFRSLERTIQELKTQAKEEDSE